MVDCYNKPGNKDKYPNKTFFQKLSPLGPSKNKNQLFRVWLIKILEEDSDDLDSFSKNIRINSMSIEKISDPILPNRKKKRTPKLDFLLKL